ncbi:MAG: NAD(P)-dependent oxidoreductase [Vulcanimicrobiaceae bacterium]
MESRETIGIVGVGRMGANIGRRLRDLGYRVTAVYDVRPDVAADVAKELGSQACSKLADITRLSDTIVTVVTDDKAMYAIFSTQGDSLLTNSSGKLFINTATITPQVHVDVERLAKEHGAMALEACMASSIPQARDGTLYLMVAGDERAFQRAKPLLEGMSKSLRYVGKTGDAAKVKALVNMVMNINTAGLAEGLGIGSAMGLNLDMLREVFSQTGANSRVLETDSADMVAREHDCFFSAAHAAKDSGIALKLAEDYRVRAPLAEATKDQYDRMVQLGLGELDKSGIAELTFPGRHS